MTTREKFHQLICLYELGILCYRDYGQWRDLFEMNLEDGLCMASSKLIKKGNRFWIVEYKPNGAKTYWWKHPFEDAPKSYNLRALQVRLDWLYEQLNKLK